MSTCPVVQCSYSAVATCTLGHVNLKLWGVSVVLHTSVCESVYCTISVFKGIIWSFSAVCPVLQVSPTTHVNQAMQTELGVSGLTDNCPALHIVIQIQIYIQIYIQDKSCIKPIENTVTISNKNDHLKEEDGGVLFWTQLSLIAVCTCFMGPL